MKPKILKDNPLTKLKTASLPENEIVRKIQLTSKSTYILALPKKWIHEMHLKPGDPVTIVRESELTLSVVPNILRRDTIPTTM